MRCLEIMRQWVQSVVEDDTVQTAAWLMRESDVGFVPVRDAGGTVIGVLTDRDIATRVCASDDRASEITVGAVMTRGVVACRPDDPVARATQLMRRHRLTRILITDALGAPVGVLSLSDIAQYERPARTGRTLQAVAERKYTPRP